VAFFKCLTFHMHFAISFQHHHITIIWVLCPISAMSPTKFIYSKLSPWVNGVWR
jgi:hypothetical protein